jgi:RecJ-like exonuclease
MSLRDDVPTTMPCPKCRGVGDVHGVRCSRCDGTGDVPASEEYLREHGPLQGTPLAMTEIALLAKRLLKIDAGLSLVASVGDAFGHATGALLDEMQRLRAAT